MSFNASLNINNLCLKRGERMLFKGFSLSLGAGEAAELRGSNGIGKTTLLRAIAGLHKPFAGNIKISGNDDFDNKDYLMFLGHLDSVKANDSVISQLNFWAQMFGGDAARIPQIAEHLHIKRILPLMGASLSAGQKKRVAIARLLLANRPIWLLDEPFSPLDDVGREILGNIFDEHRSNGGIIVTAVHDTPKGMPMQRINIQDYVVKNGGTYE